MSPEKLRELQAEFLTLTPKQRKEYVLLLHMVEAEGLISPPLSPVFLALLEPEHDEQ